MNTDRLFCVLVPLIRPVVVGRAGAARRAYFDALAAPTGRVLFLGDSITQGGLWEDLFPELRTANRGIGGETTSDVLERLDDAVHGPSAVSLMIGTNDLHGPRSGRDNRGIAERVDTIVRRIRERAPSASLLLNSVSPRTSLFANRVQGLNDSYRRIAENCGAVYVDLWPALADASGALRKEFTRDNLHFTPAGYLAWRDVLRPHLASFTTSSG